jgi:uncharacterized protein YcfJ
MKNNRITAAIALVAMFATGQASADSRNSYTDTAKVLDVDPIYETVSVYVPEEHCWSTPKRHRRHQSKYYDYKQNKSYTGAIAGGIIGGVIGNQFGHGSGKKAMTVAGSLLGLSIGHDLSQNTSYRYDDHYDKANHRYKGRNKHCETTSRYESRDEIAGYRVKYRYKGKRFWTRTQNHPGDRIRVRVKVEPLHNNI